MSTFRKDDSERITETVRGIWNYAKTGDINSIYTIGNLIDQKLIVLADKTVDWESRCLDFILQARRMTVERDENLENLEDNYQKVRPTFVTPTGAPTVIAVL
ncbi:MAG: hypothetical protein WC521_08030 [Bdellovibrionales bacterium]